MEIAYVAHTATSTLLLDQNGICIRVEFKGRRVTSDAGERCVGAQFVASLDPAVPGGLAAQPTVGAPMVFAAMGLTNGRIYLVRTGPLVAFEELEDDVPTRNAWLPEEGASPRASAADDQLEAGWPTPAMSDYDDSHDTDVNTTPWHRAKAKSQPLYVPPQVKEIEPYTVRRPEENGVPSTTRYAFPSGPSHPPPRRLSSIPPPPRKPSSIPPPPPRARTTTPPPLPPPPPYASYRPPAHSQSFSDWSPAQEPRPGASGVGGPAQPMRPTRPYPPPIPIMHVPTPSASSEPTPLRRRPPAPSSHAWLRGSPAALLMRAK